jgi:CBS domain containing-hemolysin-like protein
VSVLIPLGIIVLLILANALFVAAEFAIVGAPRTQIEHAASEGGRLARRVARILESPRLQDRYIATTQLGISIASLGLGMYGESVLASWVEPWLQRFEGYRWFAAHTVASVVAISILTYFHIVLGEVVPKALALQAAQQTVLFVSPVIEALQFALSPLVSALNAAGGALLGIIGVRRQGNAAERYHTSEELRLIIAESEEGGLLRGESGRILRDLFEFGSLTAGEVMVPRVRLVGIPTGTDVDELREIIRRSPHTRYPIYNGDFDHIVGNIHVKVLLRHLMTNRAVTSRDARPLPYVPSTAPLDQLLSAMRRNRAHMAVVMDEHGGTAGLVTIGDLFEEVVGDIAEERGRGPIYRDATGRLMVRGTVRLSTAGDALGVAFEHPEVQSVGGLVLSLLGRPAAVGDAVSYKSILIEVASTTGLGVGEVAMTRERVATTSTSSP